MSEIKYILLLILTLISTVLLSENDDKVENGEDVFASDIVHEIRITMLQCNYWDSLMYYKNDSTGTNTYMQSTITFNGEKYFGAGVRIKGESSFDFYPGIKKSLKIKFNKFNKKQKLNGLKTINLNNSFKDPTFMREKIFLDFLREQDLPAPRCTYANVYINDQHLGLYLIVEQIDKRFLKYNFNEDTGNLYKGEPNATLEYLGEDQNIYRRSYRVKRNSTDDISDLIGFTRILNDTLISEKDKCAQLNKIFNVENCLKIWAATNLFCNIDSYNMEFRHNYYLYNHPLTQKFEWIPYDANYAFCAWSPKFTLNEAENLSVVYKNKNLTPLMDVVFENCDYKKFYINYYEELIDNAFTQETINIKIDSLAIKIRKYVYEDGVKMYTNKDFETNINTEIGDDINDPGNFIPGLKSFVDKRRKSVLEELNSF